MDKKLILSGTKADDPYSHTAEESPAISGFKMPQNPAKGTEG